LALALRGRAQSEHRLGRWQEADRVWSEAIGLARDSTLDWKPVERRAVRWELAQEALSIGQWREGWSEVGNLMKADEAERGPFNLSSVGDQMLWLHYCVILRQERRASEWLASRRRFFEDKSPPPPSNANWLLLEATVVGLTGQRAAAQELLAQSAQAATRLPQGPVLQAWRASRIQTTLRLAVHETDQRAVDQAVADLVVLAEETSGQQADGRIARTLAVARALAARMRGAGAAPVPLLAHAVLSLESSLGPDHPDTLTLRLNLALQQWQTNPDVPRARAAAIASRRLRDALPADHSVGQWAADLGNRLDRWAVADTPEAEEKSGLMRMARRVILL
jgi:hypothetical protein